MNELEIAVWSLDLDTHRWAQSGFDRDLFLFVTAFQAKVFLIKLIRDSAT